MLRVAAVVVAALLPLFFVANAMSTPSSGSIEQIDDSATTTPESWTDFFFVVATWCDG